jgi:hypothetical protein
MLMKVMGHSVPVDALKTRPGVISIAVAFHFENTTPWKRPWAWPILPEEDQDKIVYCTDNCLLPEK